MFHFDKDIKDLENYIENGDLNSQTKSRISGLIDETRELHEKVMLLSRFGNEIKNLDTLSILENILTTSRKLTNAEGGTVYSLEEVFSADPLEPSKVVERKLVFQVMQNEPLGTFMGGKTGKKINVPPVPLIVNGKPNRQNVSAYCANFSTIINLEDVYNADGFDFTGTKKYDQNFGYRSKSMLVYPLRDPHGEVLGVMQLINRKNQEGEVIPFMREDQELLYSLAIIVALVLSLQTMLKEHTQLFNAFIRIIAQGLGEKSPHTYKHISRVAGLSQMISKAITECGEGIYQDVAFSQEDLQEMSIASWMHDIGKMTTPEHIVAKGKKLQALVDRMELITERLDSKMKDIEIKALREELACLRSAGADDPRVDAIRETKNAEIESVKKISEFLFNTNAGAEFLSEEMMEEVVRIAELEIDSRFSFSVEKDELVEMSKVAALTFSEDSPPRKLMTECEKNNLLIQRGTLNDRERAIINDHAERSWRWLNSLPFPKTKKALPLYAGAHHEALDGSGYPNKLIAENLPIQARILAVADIFEALSSSDRPYAKPRGLFLVMEIFGEFVKKKHIDPEIARIFVYSDYFAKYVEENLGDRTDEFERFDREEWIRTFVPTDFDFSLPRKTWSG